MWSQLLVFCILPLTVSSTWHCGKADYAFTGKIARAIAAPSSDPDHINQCCEQHDRDLNDYQRYRYPSLSEADSAFSKCLDRSNSLYTRFVVRPVYWCAVRLNSLYLFFTNW